MGIFWYFAAIWIPQPKRENLVSERRVDLSFSTSMRVNERIESSRKLFNELGGRFFIIV